MNDLQNAEEQLVQNTKEAGHREKAYAAAVSKQAFLLSRNGQLPITAVSAIEQRTSNMPVITYKQDGAGMASSGDLGYVYGTTTINGKADNYLRIWRREGKEWKLVLEVLPY